MWLFNSVFGKIFDYLLLPFRSMNPWIGMTVISLLTGLLMLLIYRYTSNQTGIKKVKNKIKAHLLEIRLYKDSLGLSLKAQGNILLANVKYIGLNFRPLLVMIVPVLLILIQLNFWFGYETLKTGQSTLLKVKLTEGTNPVRTDIALDPSPDIKMEVPPLRIEEDAEINWRISPQTKGTHDIRIVIGSQKITKSIVTDVDRLSKISPIRHNRNFFNNLFYPVEKPIQSEIPVKSIEIAYPSKHLNLFGLNVHWLIAYFALSIVFGFAFKGVFKVEI
ncbi:MAG: hypothetical protein JXB23_08430 [Candidatus Aminicenantes bacterium]|nr:hypothetical protein [Candidatus Aminicenantes bacterium]